MQSHQASLGALIGKALDAIPEQTKSSSIKRKIDFISCTRGPGMLSSLSVGLTMAKGVAVTLGVPLVGVHHMQAHALTPRLLHAMESDKAEPDFPFLTLLISGGHTLLVHSKGLVDHQILASTTDIAIGDALDKIARNVLPKALIEQSEGVMYGKLLESFAFASKGEVEYEYEAPRTRAQELSKRPTKWSWTFGVPLAETKSGAKSRAMEYSFSGTESAVTRFCSEDRDMPEEERRDMAREAMRVCFEHLASRVVLALSNTSDDLLQKVETLVISGGVAANGYMRHM